MKGIIFSPTKYPSTAPKTAVSAPEELPFATTSSTSSSVISNHDSKDQNIQQETEPCNRNNIKMKHFELVSNYYNIPNNNSSKEEINVNTEEFVTISPVISKPKQATSNMFQSNKVETESPIQWKASNKHDFLNLMLPQESNNDRLYLNTIQKAQDNAIKAQSSLKEGNIQEAISYYYMSSREYKDVAVAIHEFDSSCQELAHCFLLLSHSQASSANSLNRIWIAQRQNLNLQHDQKNDWRVSIRHRILNTESKPEVDITDSTFLGSMMMKTDYSTIRSPSKQDSVSNPVDDMLLLEKELRNMDVSLKLHHQQKPAKNSNTTDSFCILNDSALTKKSNKSSKINITTTTNSNSNHQPHQIIRLLDSLKTLTDENAALLQQVQSTQSIQKEFQTTLNTIEEFKKEYQVKFQQFKSSLGKDDLVKKSKFWKDQQHDVVITKLGNELRKEREENKKKDVALKKYEAFYKEVKVRSAAKLKEKKNQHKKQNSHN